MSVSREQALKAQTLINEMFDPATGLFHLTPALACTFEELEEVQRILPVDTDSYKVSMWKQYPPNTKRVRSYIESRGGFFDHVLHAGVQPFLHTLQKPITARQIDIAEVLWSLHGEPFPRETWDYVLEVHGGVPPIRIWGAEEGLVIPTRNVVVVVESNDDNMPQPGALTTWAETGLLRATWYMSTVATTDWHIKQMIKGYYETSVPEEDWAASLLFRLHDFGSRGVSSNESAAIGGTAHLINFMGTDTFCAIPFAIRHYYAKPQELGFSIAAMEHSTVTGWGREHEQDAFENMSVHYANPNVPYAMVIDSYDPHEAVKGISNPDGKIVKLLKERKAICVIRPDSGNPVELIPQLIRIIEQNVGHTVNRKGYKVLNHFRVIWGDGINMDTIHRILNLMVTIMGYAADNFAFGMGGALLQIVNRDDQMYAMKCSSIYIEGEGWRDVYKQPSGMVSKASKKGRVSLFKDADGRLVNLIEESDEAKALTPMLHLLYDNGTLPIEWIFNDLRRNSDLPPLENAKAGHSSQVYAPLA